MTSILDADAVQVQEWPPDYLSVLAEREQRIRQLESSPELWQAAKAYYSDEPVEFIQDWCITYDPRNVPTDKPEVMPFILFDKQIAFVDFLCDCLDAQTGGLVEKCRDMGATWVCCAFSIWLWLFKHGSSVGWGSRKEMLVDKLGDPDSIFEKMRKIIEYLPVELLPIGFNPKDHLAYMKIINPENGATITGEAGDNIGRGGRKLIYFKDESAHYPRPESIEAAISENTNVPIDISSVKGTANIFYRKRSAGQVWGKVGDAARGMLSVFIFDWRDHPAKTQEWYDLKREEAVKNGLLHIFKQEVDRDYSGSLENTVILSEWVQSAIDANKKLGIDGTGKTIAALDVADEGVDKNGFAVRKGVCLIDVQEWAKGDTGQTAQKAISLCKQHKVSNLQYDSIGVGAGVKAETNRMKRENTLPVNLKIEKWNAASSPQFPKQHINPHDKESPKWEDFVNNIKAQGWWQLRTRFLKTHQAVTEGVQHKHDELISIPSGLANIHELTNELTQVTYSFDGKGKVVIVKKPSGTKSPNLADAVMMCYWPIQKAGFFV